MPVAPAHRRTAREGWTWNASRWSSTSSSSGAGPSGLSTAIRLRQLCAEHGSDLSVCIVEKGSEVGAHILSGAVLEPRSLEELFPDWKERGAPLHTPAREDRFLFLTRGGAVRLPTPPQMHNAGNYIISLGNLCRWLGEQAEALDVSIFPGFPAAEVLYHEDGSVRGVATRDMGDRARRAAERELRAGGGAARAGHRLRRGLPRPPGPRRCSSASISARASTRRPTASASRSCGRSSRPGTSRG